MNDQVAFYRDKVAKEREDNSAFEATMAQRAATPPKPTLEPLPVEPLFPEDAWTEEDQQALLGAVLDKEFWTQDITRSLVTTGKNFASLTAGVVGDLAQPIQDLAVGLLNARMAAIDPHGQVRSAAGQQGPLESPDIAFTSEAIAEKIGGDPTHPSWLPAALVAPIPGSGEIKAGALLTKAAISKMPVVAATLGGLGGWVRGGGKALEVGVGPYARFLKLEKELGGGPMDMRTVAETGWVRGHDGNPKFIISDEGMRIKDYPLKEGKNVMQYGDYVEHDKLYRYYPDVAKMRLTVWGEKLEDGTIAVRKQNPKEGGSQAGYVRRGSRQPDDAIIYAAKGERALKGSLLHEASHLIQESEGFSSGTTLYSTKFMKGFAHEVMSARMLSKLSIDDLANRETVEAFVKEMGGPNVSSFTLLEQRAIATKFSRYSEADFADEVAGIQAGVEENLSRLAHVFEMVLRKRDPSDAEKIKSLLSSPESPELIAALSTRAYDNKLGELESNLANWTQEWDDTMWAQAKEDPIARMMRQKDPTIDWQNADPTDDILIGRRGDQIPKEVPTDAVNINKARLIELDEEMQRLSDQIDKLEADKIKAAKWGPTSDPEGAEFWNNQIQGMIDDKIDALSTKFDEALDEFNSLEGGRGVEVKSVEDLYIKPAYLLTDSKQRVEFLRNPTERELRAYIKRHRPINLRYLASAKEGLIVWDAALALHDDFVKGLKIENAGINSIRSRGNRDKYDVKEWGDVEPEEAPTILLGRMGD